MAIVGDHPESGLRFALARAYDAEAPWVYRGDVFTPDARFALVVTVAADGDVKVTAPPGAPEEVAEKTRLLFRALYKQAKDSPGGAPPRKVVRWRGEK